MRTTVSMSLTLSHAVRAAPGQATSAASSESSPSSTGTRMLARPFLVGGITFMDAAFSAALDQRELVAWMDRFLVTPGLMPVTVTVHEPSVGAAALEGDSGTRLPRIVSAARLRAAAQLGGLVAKPRDDSFLTTALVSGRVQRVRADGEARWRPHLRGHEALGDMVMALFVADILENREQYDARLVVCEACGRVAFGGAFAARTRCAVHPPRAW